METKKPKTLYEAVAYLFECVSEENLEEFKSTEERWCMIGGNVLDGMGVRNEWNLWDHTSPLSRWFATHGVYHADDKSATIFKCLWMTLNNREYNFSADVKYYQKYWNDMGVDVRKDCGFE